VIAHTSCLRIERLLQQDLFFNHLILRHQFTGTKLLATLTQILRPAHNSILELTITQRISFGVDAHLF
jgi:hypothetical protein